MEEGYSKIEGQNRVERGRLAEGHSMIEGQNRVEKGRLERSRLEEGRKKSTQHHQSKAEQHLHSFRLSWREQELKESREEQLAQRLGQCFCLG